MSAAAAAAAAAVVVAAVVVAAAVVAPAAAVVAAIAAHLPVPEALPQLAFPPALAPRLGRLSHFCDDRPEALVPVAEADHLLVTRTE